MTYSNKQMNEYMKNRYRNRRENAIDHLGGFCSVCGVLENLEFHHKDPTQKNFTIARASSFSEKRFWSEIEQCVLLCSDCHITHHHREHPCGDVRKYWQGCNVMNVNWRMPNIPKITEIDVGAPKRRRFE